MKKRILLVLISIVLIGCNQNQESNKESTNVKIDENTKVESAKVEAKTKDEELLNLLKADAITDFEVEKSNNDVVVLKNNKCKINAVLVDGKTTKIISTPITKVDEDACVFRTLIKDKDLLSDNKELFQEYMNNFREKKEFIINGIKVVKSNNGIEFIKE